MKNKPDGCPATYCGWLKEAGTQHCKVCEWFLEKKPTRTQVKEKVKWNKEMLEE